MQPNELIYESSVYLKQHAYNPVNWKPWTEKSLQAAKELQKPILLSIGYAACHWCHVMEEESFSSEEVAMFMNEHFINIKVDREERPDLDHIYMEALQTLTGSGGWPMNMFLTPEGKAFYGGTYFPPHPMQGRPSWMDVLSFINDVWLHRRDDVNNQADRLLDSKINLQNRLILPEIQTDESGFDAQINISEVISNIMRITDQTNGGFGQSPKFPQFNTIRLMFAIGKTQNHTEAKMHALRSVNAMIRGGIYDHLVGGISRYSTDACWKVPHFEKMLCDNAMLITVLSEAYQITGNPEYKETAFQTIEFCNKELRSPEGVFFAAIDADSEGEEGLYYTWKINEIEDILDEDARFFCQKFGVLKEGNWEGKNVLYLKDTNLEAELQSNDAEHGILKQCKEKLRLRRNLRNRPQTDTQQILAWNALMVIAYCKAAAAFSNTALIQNAVELHEKMLITFSEPADLFYHTSTEGKKGMIACLDDYAYLIESCILLQELTGDNIYLEKAVRLTQYVKQNFSQPNELFCSYTHTLQQDSLFKHVDIYDLTTPSGNSSLAWSLTYLGNLMNIEEWKVESRKMLQKLKELIKSQPVSFSGWAMLALGQVTGWKQVALTGFDIKPALEVFLAQYMPFRVLQSSDEEKNYPLLINKDYSNKAMQYVCENFTCLAPTSANFILEKN